MDAERATLGCLLARMDACVPVRKLRAAAVRIADGDTDLFLQSTRSDELGELARALDRMRDRLQRASASLALRHPATEAA